jgi:porin
MYKRSFFTTILLITSVSIATPPPGVTATPPEYSSTTEPDLSAASVGFFSDIGRRGNLLGDMGGLRTLMSRYGITLNIQETSEVLGNATGGAKTGAEYDGLTVADLQIDTQRAFGLHGGTFNISALQIHGRNLSSENLLTLQTSSGIEADRATRLWEMWYQQSFTDEDRFNIRIGQQSLDQEFMVSQEALLFVNTMFGWPMVPSADLPGGGPAYPLSALGVRGKVRPTDSITILGGVYNGSPLTNAGEDSSGTSFPLNGGVLAIAEIQYAYPALGSVVYTDKPQLSGTYRLGVWYDSETFPDQEFATTHRGDYGIYAVVDQMLWHSEEDSDRAISFFFRPMGTPEEDRNEIDFSMNIGLTLHDPLPQRDDDTFGIGLGYAQVSGRASDLDRDVEHTLGIYYPIRSSETFVEVTYQYQLTPWCQIQPDFQYVFNPGGGVLNPNNTSERVKDEAIFGLRVNITF